MTDVKGQKMRMTSNSKQTVYQ